MMHHLQLKTLPLVNRLPLMTIIPTTTLPTMFLSTIQPPIPMTTQRPTLPTLFLLTLLLTMTMFPLTLLQTILLTLTMFPLKLLQTKLLTIPAQLPDGHAVDFNTVHELEIVQQVIYDHDQCQETLVDEALLTTNKSKELGAKKTELEQWKTMGVYKEVENI